MSDMDSIVGSVKQVNLNNSELMVLFLERGKTK